jgi:hypothetical protein
MDALNSAVPVEPGSADGSLRSAAPAVVMTSARKAPHRAKQMALHGSLLDRAVHLFDVDGLSMEAVAREIGMSAPTVQNAVYAALCAKRGHRPAERDDNGYLTTVGRDRLRELLRKGMKHVDIQIRLAVSAGTVSNERRAYSADLKLRGKRPLPLPNHGEAYSGLRITNAQSKEVEAHLLTGLGSTKVSVLTGVSKTVCVRIRLKLVARLKRKGELLAGCDANGRRVKLVDQAARVPDADIERFRALLLDQVPVKRAALMANIGSSSAYRLRDVFRAELASRGEELPGIKKLGRVHGPVADARATWLPKGRKNYVLYREKMLETGGNAALARRLTVLAIAERDGDDPYLAEQFDRMKRGAGLVERFDYRRSDPSLTLGGVSAGML